MQNDAQLDNLTGIFRRRIRIILKAIPIEINFELITSNILFDIDKLLQSLFILCLCE
jgi:hypothetical protein